MGKIKNFLNSLYNNLKTTFIRFPVVLVFLAFTSAIFSILINREFPPNEDFYTRLIFTGIFGALISTAIQFLIERFELSKYEWSLRASAFIFAALYYLFMTHDIFSQSMLIHLFVISIALISIYLYLPSAKNKVEFSKIALVHFKSLFTALLYGVVIYLGLILIYFAVNQLLYKLNYRIYSHTANVVFIFFTPVYYLSLLPKFNSKEDEDIKKTKISQYYPKVLEILVSFIMIPLISAFSGVLIIYFIKILISGVWPVGLVGPMVLGYSAAGLIIYILGVNLENKFATLYRRIFPFVLIPLVLMQLVSVYIRIEAYGFTESRYYVTLFGIYSIAVSLYLIISKNKNSNMIVLLSACFALISIIQPVDAFTVSRNNQKSRIEEILVRNEMLVNGDLIQKSNIPNEDKAELTNKTNYMERMGYLESLEWIPQEYYSMDNYYRDFEKIYGFQPYYDYNYPSKYLYAILSSNELLNIGEYDNFFKIGMYSSTNSSGNLGEFIIGGKNYVLNHKSDDKGNLTLSIFSDNEEVIVIPMNSFIDNLFETNNDAKSQRDASEMSYEIENDNIKLKILFEDINLEKDDTGYKYINGSALVFMNIK